MAETMCAEVVSIGEELLLGEIPDTNASHIAKRLFELGVRVSRIHVVGDRREDAVAVLGGAIGRAALVVITGGLGPTQDDITREAIAAATGRRLVYRDELLDAVAAGIGRTRDELRENQKRQAMVVSGSEVIANPNGSAPGIALEHEGTALFALPGVPSEMRAMLADAVLPAVKERRKHTGVHVCVRRLYVVGLGESEIDARLGEMLARGRNPDVGTRAGGGRCALRIVARGETPAQAEGIAERTVQHARKALEGHVVGEDERTPEVELVALLIERNLTVAVAESCTGGLICGRLTDVPGCSAALREGMVVYADGAKTRQLGVDEKTISRYGAVSSEVAKEMALGARRRSDADVALAVTGIAGPGGGRAEKPVGLVHFAVASNRGVRAQARNFRGDRAQVRERAVAHGLEMIREEALAVAPGP